MSLSRRDFLASAAGAAAAAAGTGVAASIAGAGNASPSPVRDGEGAPVLGPRNEPIERENPDAVAPPATDSGTIPNLKFPFSAAHTRITTGGWAREVTVRELPVATELAGVDMRLTAGGIRELHWHKEAEWAFMLAGRARITAIDVDGRTFIDDVGEGDIWNFPAGIPHSIQGLADGCEFLLIFDDGTFSENGTFLLTDWATHTPPAILAKNFGVPESAFSHLPTDIEHTRYIFAGKVPAKDTGRLSGAETVRVPFSHRFSAQEPIEAPGGKVWIVDSRTFPPATTVAAALVEVDPGGMRELHWHPTTDEWQYYISGRGRMTVFASIGSARTFDYQAGDVGYVPFAMGHYVENTGDDAAALPRSLSKRPVRRHLLEPMVGSHSTGTRAGAPEHRPQDGGSALEDKADRRPVVLHGVAEYRLHAHARGETDRRVRRSRRP